MPVKILDDNLINKIAAGEVVERPSSVVKELVENSIDAGAKFIIVDIKNGGMDLIDVSDDGFGMEREDARMCVQRHATSKIESIEDLYSISSFGFRGEALAAISAVSQFSLQTKKKGEMSGVMILNTGIKDNWEIKETGCPSGTKVRIESLFYNVPARKKFLKSSATEFNHILNILVNIALVNPSIRIKFIHNGKIIFDYPLAEGDSEKSFGQRVKAVLGNDNFSNMAYFCKEAGEMIIEGYASYPANVKMNRGQQYLFVNNRPVYNNIVHRAIYNGYRNLIPKDMHPMFVIKLDLEPEMVDVNVHPRKMEVKFLRQQDVFKTVEAVIREIVQNQANVSSQIPSENNNYQEFKPRQFNHPVSSNFRLPFKKSCDGSVRAMKFNQEMLGSEKTQAKEIYSNDKQEINDKNWKILGQINKLYLVIDTADGIVLIDQHAAHERIIYDKLKDSLEKEDYKHQQLLAPVKLELSVNEMKIVSGNLEIFNNLGFELEEFGTTAIMIQSVPTDIANKNIIEIIKGIINDFFDCCKDDLKADEKSLEAIRNRAICYMACRGAVKAGDSLPYEEQEKLVMQFMDGDIKPTCPHGRPISKKLTFDEIAKYFKR